MNCTGRGRSAPFPRPASDTGGYCSAIAWNILHSREDTEECVNDTWLRAWNAMPPHRPSVLSAFLGKLTRNLALDRYQRYTAEKRGGGEVPAILDELSPFSVTMHLDAPNYYYAVEDNDEARAYEEEHLWTHQLNVALRRKDGGASPFVSNGGQQSGRLSEPTLKSVYHGQFDPPVPMNEVEAIVVCGTEIPIK